MRTANSEVRFRESRDRVRDGIRFAVTRRARFRALVLEFLESRMLLAAPAAPSTPTLVDDTGTFNDDDITDADNSAVSPAPSNAPLFDVSGVEAGATVVLYRDGLAVSQVVSTSGATVAIADLNGGDAPGQDIIPSGVYVYRAQQVDQAGNASPLSAGLTVTIDADPPLAPPAPLLDPASDTSHGFDVTTYDNNPTLDNPPVIDVADINVGASVILYRAPVIGGVVGTFAQVNALIDTAGGTVAIADVNGGDGLIPDGSYVYQSQQIDIAGNVGSLSVDGATITIDTTPPSVPSAPALVEADDTGVSDTDGITAITDGGYPAFEVSGIEGEATLRLFRLAPGASSPVLVASAIEPVSATPLTVSIADLSEPTPDGIYVYTAQQVDLAGNVSPMSAGTTVTYDTASPPTPSAPVLDPAGTGNPPETSVPDPTFQVNVAVSGLELDSSLSLVRDGTVVAQGPYDLTSGTVKITDPGPVAAGTHSYQVYLTDLAGNTSALSASTIVAITPVAPSMPTLAPSSDSGTKGDGITNVTSNLKFDVAVATTGDTVELYRDGQLVATSDGPGVLTDPGPLQSGQTYTYTAEQVAPDGTAGPLSPAMNVTIVTQAATPTLVGLDPSTDSGTPGDHVTDVTSNLLLDVSGVSVGATVYLYRDGAMVNSLGSTAGGTVVISDPGPLALGSHAYSVAQIDAAGNSSLFSIPLDIQVVAAPTRPTLALDPASDSGTAGDDITDVDGSGGVFPRFDVGGVEAGATLSLLRDGVVVQTLTDAPAGTVALTDDPGGTGESPGPIIPDGVYQYMVQQIDIYGDSATSAALTVQFASRAPDPGTPVLESGSDTVAVGDDVTSVRSPVFDISGVPAGETLELLRDGVVVDSVATATGGTVAIADPGPLLDGTYSYAAQIVDGAGNVGPVSGAVSVSVVTVPGDYTGSGHAEEAMFQRVNAGDLEWYIAGQSSGIAFGSGTLDVPLQGDLTGDGKTDLILYRPSTSTWYVLDEATGSEQSYQFGGPGDIPVVADFTGVGHDELGVYDPSTGNWYVAGMGSPIATFGGPDDVPVPLVNYDGTGQAVLAVYRETTGQWFVAGQSGPIDVGGAGDIPVPLYNYTGNGRDTLAVYNPGTSMWYVDEGGQETAIPFGAAGDIPVAEDFDGVGHDELGVYDPSTGNWYVAGHATAVATFGGANDIPLGAPYAYRALPAGDATSLPGSSVAALDFAASAVSLSSGSGAGQVVATADTPATTTPTGDGADPAAAAATSVVVQSATDGVAASPKAVDPGEVHDSALADLEGAGGPRRRRGISSLLA